MWPTAFALTELPADDEATATIGALVKKAVSRGLESESTRFLPSSAPERNA